MNEEHCPICESKMRIINRYTTSCKNGCYTLVRTGYRREEIVFGQYFVSAYEESSYSPDEACTGVNERIAYWKENDRYLTKLMEN